MDARISSVVEKIRSSYWFVPATMSFAAIALATLMLFLDRHLTDLDPSDTWWLYGGGEDGARVVLSTIVTAMISVTSVVFSISMVTLTLAAGQFGSRVLRNFMRDRGNQITLGTFIATFVYALLVLRTVRGGEDAAFVPPLAMSFSFLLVVLSVGVLIYFIHHVANSIQADSVVRLIALETEEAIDRLFPASIGQGPDSKQADAPSPGLASLPARFDAEAKPLRASAGNYLQVVDDEHLMRLAVAHGLIVRLHARPGSFVVQGGIIACIWKDGGLDAALVDEVREVFVLGRSRTLQQDSEFGLLQLVEVAVRALSSGINDPFTAMTCVDRISSLLCRLTTRPFPAAERFDDDGCLRVVVEASSFADFVDAGFDQIRQNAGHSIAVLTRLFAALERIGAQATSDMQRQALARQAEFVLQAGLAQDPPPSDRRALERAHASALGMIHTAPARGSG